MKLTYNSGRTIKKAGGKSDEDNTKETNKIVIFGLFCNWSE